ncbi:MAG: hypothetical protein A2Y07_08660 [Planctomycetes bacterium GWF2_50_10]|nr:MAG: hypothetical protein A2Y07_08660 [Planctomycetes bacterium GWF2_50_10]
MNFSRLFVVLATVCIGGCAGGAVEPTLAAKVGVWTLDVSFEHPQNLVMRVGGEGVKKFWYVLATVTNNTGKEVEFYPSAQLVTDTYKSYQANEGLRRSVFDKIKQRHRSRYPFLESFEAVGNVVLQGEDNAKDIAIVFPDFDPNARTVKIYITGLSNETVIIDHPTQMDESGKPVGVILKKTLELEYAIPGDKALRDRDGLVLESKRWVMR